jgi:carboxyl-terminal processing protease
VLASNPSCCPTQPADAVRDCVNDMLKGTHDRFNHWLSPKETAAFRDSQRSFGGVGMKLEEKEENGIKSVHVVEVLEGAPANLAGIVKGDVITVVGTQNMHGASVEEVATALRGEPGTDVMVVFDHDGKPAQADITRALINWPDVKFADLPDGSLYIRLSGFSKDDTGDIIGKRMTSKNYTGYVLDLRNNPGGLLNVAEDVSDLFLKGGTIYTTKSRSGGPVTAPTYRVEPNDVDNWFGEPFSTSGKRVVVLVNGGSASAAEIVTGALKDNHAVDNVTVIGTKTFGKGIVQTLIPMADGTLLKLTTARYFTPSGFWPGDADQNRNGIDVDIVFDRPQGELADVANDPEVQRAEQVIDAPATP